MGRVTLLIYLFIGYFSYSQLEFTKLSDSSYIYTTYQEYKGVSISAHGFLKVTDRGVILIDTPWDTTQFQPLIDSVQQKFGKNICLVLSTHFHEDRSGGLDFYRKNGIPTYSTYTTKHLCKENGLPQAQFTFEGDSTFQIGNTVFETYYPGAGHTPDNIVVYFPAERILVGGCFIKSIDATDLGNLGDANIGMWPYAVKNLMHRYPKISWVIPGHDRIGGKGKKALRHTHKLCKQTLKGRKHEKKNAK